LSISAICIRVGSLEPGLAGLEFKMSRSRCRCSSYGLSLGPLRFRTKNWYLDSRISCIQSYLISFNCT